MTEQTVWRSLLIPPTTCSVLWKCWTMTGSWNAKRICSPSEPSGSTPPCPAWIRPAKPLRFPSGKKRGWICRICPSCAARARKKSFPNWPALSSKTRPMEAIHYPAGRPLTNTFPAMSERSCGKPIVPLPMTRLFRSMYRLLRKHSPRIWTHQRLRCGWVPHGLPRITTANSCMRCWVRPGICAETLM